MQMYFLNTKRKNKVSPAVWSPQAGRAMFTVQNWATKPALRFYLSCGAVDLSYIPFNAISLIPHAVT